MKPPQRRRTVPARYLGEVSGPTAWSAREKRQLLRLLQARRGQPEPDAAEMAQEFPGRSEVEIRDFLQQLKGRVVREAIQRVHPGGSLKPQKAQIPAPIEIWMDLAEKITGPLEGALSVAFSQVLTIAATEPISLLHSKPPKPTQAQGKPLLLTSLKGQVGPTLESSSGSLAGPCTEGDFVVDFEKIYKYLSSFSCSGHGPDLSAAESAVVLDLLMSLPEELARLPCTALVEHMAETYRRLTVPEPSPVRQSLVPGAEGDGTGARRPEDPGQATPPPLEPTELRSPWQAAGICPLNPFLVPLELLGRTTTPAIGEGQQSH
ncbi:snRNA-activating protein complex subunit 2 [Nycticebus coucang]|uniref:snRNA-activating protein complex subunit 2 n=1 Tax=Nycticebus coucang TaxID=9470 RepID=UPI00234CA118|nr:snRNA-activating protein complex subunit 2 [Nycticebus coucang]